MSANDAWLFSVHGQRPGASPARKIVSCWTNDPDYKIILMGDPDMKTHANDPAKRAAFDRYPGAQAAIAMADPNVMVVNSRRIADEQYNWRLGHPKLNDYLHDQVHYSTEGGRVLAEAEMTVLLRLLQP